MYNDRRRTLGVLDINSQIPQSFSSSTKPNKNRLSLGGSSASLRAPSANSNSTTASSQPNRQSNIGRNLSSELRNLSIDDSGSRQSFGGRRSSSHGRVSNAAPLIANSGHSTVMKDPRNLKDKHWQNEAARTIMKFLVEMGYDQGGISIKTFQTPNIKDFLQVFHFIYSHLDPGYNYKQIKDIKKPEEDVPLLLKGLRYPFADSIGKHTLMTVGAPHAWPHLLGALVWMVELILCCSHINDRNDNNPIDLQDPEKIFSDWVLEAYRTCFLEGNDNVEELQDAIKTLFDQKDAKTLEECQAFETNIAAITKEIKDLHRDESPIIALQSQLQIITADSEVYVTYLKKLTDTKDRYVKQIDQQQKILERIEAEIVSWMQNSTNLAEKIVSQEMSAADVTRINAEKDRITSQITEVAQMLDKWLAEIYRSDSQLTNEIQRIESQIKDYNEMSRKLELIPSTAGNANGIDYHIQVNFQEANGDNFESAFQHVSSKLQGGKREKLLALKNSEVNLTRTLQDNKFKLQEHLESIQETIADTGRELEMLEAKSIRLSKQYNEEKERSFAYNEAGFKRCDELENKVQEMRQETTKQITDSENTISRSLMDLDSHCQASNVTKQRLENDVVRALGEMADCRLSIQDGLKELLEVCQSQVDEVQEDIENFKQKVSETSTI